MAFIYNDEGAARLLAAGMRTIESVEQEKKQYAYEYPPDLQDRERRAAEDVKAAVRWFVLGDEDEDA